MRFLRWAFLAACLGGSAPVVWNGRWQGELSHGNRTWIIDLDRAPIWSPPANPTFARFTEAFKESKELPSEETPGVTTGRSLKVDEMIVELLLYFWLVTVATGFLYFAGRGQRRDRVLHVVLSVGIGLTAALVVCAGLWATLGGWGPPFPEFLGGLGLALGIVVGWRSGKPSRAEPNLPINPLEDDQRF